MRVEIRISFPIVPAFEENYSWLEEENYVHQNSFWAFLEKRFGNLYKIPLFS